MKLERIAHDFATTESEEDKSIDFGAAGLYLPAAQTIFATTLSSCVSVLACWLIPIGAISAVRTLALTTTAGVLVIRRPVRIGQTRGVNTIFSALRPCCVIYVACLVLEQLIHTCISDESTYEHGFWRRIIYHANMTVMTFAAFLRSKNPRAESDIPFAMTTLALLVIAMLPPPALALSGPLCSPPTLGNAGERILRAFLFSCVYVVLVYSAAPISNNLPDTIVCIARSASSSAWILGAVVYSLPLALAQICIILYCSFQPAQTQYESIGGVRTEDVEAQAFITPHQSRVPSGTGGCCGTPEGARTSPTLEEDSDVAQAVAMLRNGTSCARNVGLHSNVGSLSFNLSNVVHVPSCCPASCTVSEFREQ